MCILSKLTMKVFAVQRLLVSVEKPSCFFLHSWKSLLMAPCSPEHFQENLYLALLAWVALHFLA